MLEHHVRCASFRAFETALLILAYNQMTMGSPLHKSSAPGRLSAVEAGALSFGCVIGWGAFVMPGTTFLPQGGPLGTAIAFCLGAAVMSVVAVCYGYMMRAFPVAGGAFEYARQMFGRNHAFVCAWYLGLSYLVLIPLNATALVLIARNFFGNALGFGVHYTVLGYDIYATEIALVLVVLALFAFVSVRGGRFDGAMVVALSACLAGGVAIVSAMAVASPSASLSNLEPLFSPDYPPGAGIVGILALAPWAFVGFDSISQLTEEFAFSVRKAGMLMVMSILFGLFVYVALDTVAASVVPQGYGGWADYVSNLGTLEGIDSMPVFNAAAAIAGPVGLFVIGVSALCALLTGMYGFYRATGMLVYAMAREGSLPPWFARLHPVHGTPSNAIMFLFVASSILSLLGREALGWIVDMSSIGAAIAFAYTSAATFRHARRTGRRGYAVVGAVGTVASILFAVVFLVPSVGFSMRMEHVVLFLAWTALGANYFNPHLAKRHPRRRASDA